MIKVNQPRGSNSDTAHIHVGIFMMLEKMYSLLNGAALFQ